MLLHTGLATFARAIGGKRGLLELARLSKHRRLGQIIALWDGMSKNARAHTRIEDLCDKVGLEPADFLAEVVRAGVHHNIDLSRFVLAINQPRLTRRLVVLAMRPGGPKYMEMALKAAGQFPTPPAHVLPTMRVAAVENPFPDPPSVPGLPSFDEEALIDAEFQPVAEK